MTCNLARIPTGYRVDFLDDDGEDPPFLTFTCEQVERTAWGMLTTVTARVDPGHPRTLPGGVVTIDRVNITNQRDRERMGRRMQEILGEPSHARHDWSRYLEMAAIAIDQRERAPIPVQDMTGPLPIPEGFLVVGILARGDPNILYGAGGVGKSALALRLSASVFTGQSFFGHTVMHPGGRTLYLDWEDKWTTMIHRVDMVSRGMGYGDNRLPMVLYKGLRGRGSYERHHADVMETLDQNRDVTLVVIDSTAMAMQGIPGDMAESAIRFYSLLSEIPVTVLLLDHIASDDVKSEAGTAKPYGSVFKVNSARNMWEAQRTDVGVLLRHRKHNTGPRMDDIDLRVTWNVGSVEYRRLMPQAPYVPLTPGVVSIRTAMESLGVDDDDSLWATD
jgi:hypothetical protein